MDIGKRFIGMAISDAGWSNVLPLETLCWESWGKSLPALQAVIKDRQIGGFVLGLPLNTDGSSGTAAQTILAFASNMLKNMGDLEITLMDERYTTDIAQTLLGDVRRKKASGALDATAAQIILEDFLKIYDKKQRVF